MAVSGNASSGIPSGSSLAFGPDLAPAFKITGAANPPSGTSIAQGNMVLDSQTGNWTYQPDPSEIPAVGQPDNVVCCRFRLTSLSCLCQAEFWLCACVPAETDPCEGFPTPDRFIARTCPFAAITADQIAAGAGGNWQLGSQLVSVVPCGTIPAQGSTQILNNGFTYTPAPGESGQLIQFCVTIHPPQQPECPRTFNVFVQLADYCADFVINDVGAP